MRTYSEQEVADIIARAAERQATAAREPLREGLTLDEIERLGTEAGLDPADLRAAAAEVDAGGRTLARQTSQTKTQVVVERWIDVPLTLEGWENTVDALRERLGTSAMAALGGAAGGQVQQINAAIGLPAMATFGGGQVQQIGAAFEWTHTSGMGVQTTVTASPRGERTRLRLTQLVGLGSPRAEGIAYGTGIALLLAGIAVVALAKADVAMLTLVMSALAVFAASFGIAVPATTAMDRRWRAGKLRDLDALADTLVAGLAAPAATHDRAAAPQTVAPQAAEAQAAEAQTAEAQAAEAQAAEARLAPAALRDAFDPAADETPDAPGEARRERA